MKIAPSYKKNLIYAALALLGFLLIIFINHFYANSNFRIDKSEIKYKFPPADKAASGSEIALLKEQLEKTTDATSRALAQAQLAQLYVTEAKKTSQEKLYTEAQSLAESSLKVIPKNKNAVLALSKVMSARHEFNTALTLLDELPGPGPKNEETAYLRAVDLMSLSKFDEAYESADYLTTVSPGIGTATLKALLLGQMGQDDLAFYYFKRALQLEDVGEDTQSVITRGQFATFLIKKGNYSDAILLCDSALEIQPANAYVKLVKAQAFNAQKKYSQAYELMSTAFSESKEPIYLLNMVISLKLLNRETDFKVLADEALKIYLSDIAQNRYGHLLDLAALYYVRGEFDKSSESILKDQQNRHNVRGDLMLAKIYIQTKKEKEARSIIEKQIAKGSTEPALFYLMQSILTGENSKTLKDLYSQRAKNSNPDFNPDLLLKIP